MGHRWLDMDRDGVEVQRHAKKERGANIQPSIKGFTIWLPGNFSGGTRRVVPSGQGRSILPVRVANHIVIWFILPAHGASRIIKVHITAVLSHRCLPTIFSHFENCVLVDVNQTYP